MASASQSAFLTSLHYYFSEVEFEACQCNVGFFQLTEITFLQNPDFIRSHQSTHKFDASNDTEQFSPP